MFELVELRGKRGGVLLAQLNAFAEIVKCALIDERLALLIQRSWHARLHIERQNSIGEIVGGGLFAEVEKTMFDKHGMRVLRRFEELIYCAIHVVCTILLLY